MNDTINIFYAVGCSDRKARAYIKKHGLEITEHATGVKLIFIDPNEKERQDLAAVIAKCKPGVNVYLMRLSDLGHGAKSKQIRERIEATGAAVIVPERVLGKRGPKPKWSDLTPKQIEARRTDYEQGVVSHQFICDKFLMDTGIEVTRHQLSQIFAALGSKGNKPQGPHLKA